MDTLELIQDLESRIVEAMKASNVAELDALIADDLIFTSHTGQLFTKEMDLEAHRAGNIEIFDILTSEQHIKLYDGVAVVSVEKEISGSFFGNTEVGIFRYTRVWKQTSAQWQVIAAHASQIVR